MPSTYSVVVKDEPRGTIARERHRWVWRLGETVHRYHRSASRSGVHLHIARAMSVPLASVQLRPLYLPVQP